jgi:hypothetical protein
VAETETANEIIKQESRLTTGFFYWYKLNKELSNQ